MSKGLDKELVVLWLDRSDVLNLMHACMIAKTCSRMVDADDWDRLYDKVADHLFGEGERREDEHN